MEALNDLNHQSLKAEEVVVAEVPITTPAISPPSPPAKYSPAVSKPDKISPEYAESPEMKEKLSKLQKDLKMVKEIQTIFDKIANVKGQQRKEKRSLSGKKAGLRAKYLATNYDENPYDDIMNGIIKARIWQKNKNRMGAAGRLGKVLKREELPRFLGKD